jgi:hypothetical protein
VFAALVAAGVLMVPLLENYAASGVLLTAVLLFVLFYLGGCAPTPLTTVLVLAFTLIRWRACRSRLDRRARRDLGGRRARRRRGQCGVERPLPGSARRLRPRRRRPRAARSREARAGSPGAARLIVMPVFVLALTNPSFYMAGRS